MKVKIYYVEVTPELESTEFDLASVIKAKGECIVGRSPECDLVLEGADLSRQHGKFWITDEYYYFTDLGSSNGTLLNGELAQRNREYLLNLGDTVRMGDFVLKMEPEEELAATVFKVFDPSLFKSRQQQVANTPPEPAALVVETADIIPEPASASPVVEIAGLTAAAIVTPIIIDRSLDAVATPTTVETPIATPTTDNIPAPILADSPALALEEDAWADDEDDTPAVVVPEPQISAIVTDIDEDDWGDDEDDTPDLVVPEPQISAIVTDIDEDDWGDDTPDLVVPEQSESIPLVIDLHNDTPDLALEELPISSILADPDAEEDIFAVAVAEQPISTNLVVDEDNDSPDVAVADSPISTIVADVDDEDEEEDISTVAVAEQPISSNLVVDEDNDTPDVAVADSPISTIVADVDDEDEEEDISTVAVAEQPISTNLVVDEDNDTPDVAVADSPISTIVADADDEDDEDDTPDLPAVALLALTLETEAEDAITTNIEVEEHPAATLARVDEGENNEDETEELPPSNLVVPPAVADLDPATELEIETTPSIPGDEAAVAVIAGLSTNNKNFGVELLNQKQIVLIAHDSKVADLTDLVSQHKDFLSQCLTISWKSIADSLRQDTGMVVSKELPSGVSGGFQTIAGLVNSGDVLAVIFLKDFFSPSSTQANEEALLRLCNINEIMLATNIATAESIVHYLQS
jgi:methylglyoxal synthase